MLALAVERGRVTHESEPKNEPAEAAPSAGATAPLQTVIVDPAIGESDRPAASEATSDPAARTDAHADAGKNGEAGVVASAPDASVEGAELSAFEADRFAATYRASWEAPPPPAPVATPEAAPVTAPVSARPAMAEVEPSDEPSVVPGRMSKQRALLLTAGAVVGFAALVALGLSGSKPDAPQGWSESGAKPSPTSSPAVAEAAGDEPQPARAAPPPAPEPAAVEPPSEATAPTPTPFPEANEPAGEPTATAAPAATTAAPPTPAAATTAPPAPAAAAVEPSTPAPATAGIEMVRVRVTTDPANAELTLDGRPVANPFDARVPRSGEHRIEARAPNHISRALTLDFKRDRELTMKLKRRAPAAPRRARKAPAHRAPARSKPTGAGFVSESPY